MIKITVIMREMPGGSVTTAFLQDRKFEATKNEEMMKSIFEGIINELLGECNWHAEGPGVKRIIEHLAADKPIMPAKRK